MKWGSNEVSHINIRESWEKNKKCTSLESESGGGGGSRGAGHGILKLCHLEAKIKKISIKWRLEK